jgi:thymidylate synthase
MVTANNWNVVQYAVLTHMMAQVAGLEVGELVHVIADCHIYDRHIPAVKAMLEREGYPAPKFSVDKSITDFYAFTKDSFKVEDYKFHPFDFEIPMAI